MHIKGYFQVLPLLLLEKGAPEVFEVALDMCIVRLRKTRTTLTATVISTRGAVVAPEELPVDGLQSCPLGTIAVTCFATTVVKGTSGYDCTQLKAVGTNQTTPQDHFVTMAIVAATRVTSLTRWKMLQAYRTKCKSKQTASSTATQVLLTHTAFVLLHGFMTLESCHGACDHQSKLIPRSQYFVT